VTVPGAMSSFSPSIAYYAADVGTFIGSASDAILGSITANSAFAVEPTQRDAWVI